MADKSGQWGLNGDVKYVLSACTRARENLIVYVVGYHKKVEKIVDFITKTGAGDTELVRVGELHLYEILSKTIFMYN